MQTTISTTTIGTNTDTKVKMEYPELTGVLVDNFSNINTRCNNKQFRDYSLRVEEDWYSKPWWMIMSMEDMKGKYKYYKNFNPNDIVDVKFYPPVVKMKFRDGTETIAKSQSGDEFNKETGMMICIMQYIFQDKSYNNVFRKWIRKDQDREREKVKTKIKEKEAEDVKARKIIKNQKRKEKRKEKVRKEEIEIQKEAYLLAMKEYSDSSNENGETIGSE